MARRCWTVPREQKLELLRELMSDHLEFEALDIIEPSLEQIFTQRTPAGGVAG